MTTQLNRITELAKEDPQRRFFSIAHLLTTEAMCQAFCDLRKRASAGVDGVTYEAYQQNARANVQKLYEDLKGKRYRVQPLRRVYIPKEDGRQRPISIPCLEDKIVQKATVTLLNAVYEEDFLPCSYGFRPGRSQHDALDEIGRVICRRPITYVLEADIAGYFDSIVREHLMEMVEKRIIDGSILRLLRAWISVGVIDQGQLFISETGTGQGQIISPLLANVYLHYVLDEWLARDVRPRLRGEVHEVRYADDFILCFQYREDAEKVLDVLHKRFAKYGLTLHPDKTRLIEFGRLAARHAKGRGESKPATFDFLGFTHVCAVSRNGRFTVHVRTAQKRLRRSLKGVAQWCEEHRHDPVGKQQEALNAKLRGHYQYYGRPTNYQSLWKFYRKVRSTWRQWLNRRTRGKTLPWESYAQLLHRHPLLRPRITYSWASSGSRA